MPEKMCPTRCLIALTLFAICGSVRAETFTIDDNRPVADAARQLEARYGWPITYEDPPRVYAGDLIDVSAQVRRDGRSSSEAGVSPLLVPRPGSFSFVLEDTSWTEPGTRAPEGAARAAILTMLKAYSASIGGVEMFALTESDGLFHIVPTQRKDATGKMEKITPLLDKVVLIPAGERTLTAFINEVLGQVKLGERETIGGPAFASNFLMQTKTQMASRPNESARSVLSRLFAEVAVPTPLSWALFHQPGWYSLNVEAVRVGNALLH
jgi:hypothetical protein